MSKVSKVSKPKSNGGNEGIAGNEGNTGSDKNEVVELSDIQKPEGDQASIGWRTQRTQGTRRTPPKQMARQLARQLRGERPDYDYLKQVFRCLRAELEVEIPRAPKRLPYVPSEEQIRRYYQAVWEFAQLQRHGADQDAALYGSAGERVGQHPPSRC